MEGEERVGTENGTLAFDLVGDVRIGARWKGKRCCDAKGDGRWIPVLKFV